MYIIQKFNNNINLAYTMYILCYFNVYIHMYVHCTYHIIVYKVWLMHKVYNVGFKNMKLGDMAFLTMLGFIYSVFSGEMSK